MGQLNRITAFDGLMNFVAKITLQGAIKYGFIFLLGFGTCCWQQNRELVKAQEAQAILQATIDSQEVVLSSQQDEADRLSTLADDLTTATQETDAVAQATAARAWRAKEWARIKDETTIEILDSIGNVREVFVPAEVVTRIATLDTALIACTADADLKGSALEVCNRARAAKDSVIETMTGISQIKDRVIVGQQEQISILESKRGIRIPGIGRLNIIPKLNVGYGLVYNLNCPDNSYTVNVSEDASETRTPIDYPAGFHDFTGSEFPDWEAPIETVDRTLTITRAESQSNGCQRWVHGPSAQATLINISF